MGIFGFSGLSSNLVGLDIGTSSIKVVQLRKMRKRVRLEFAAEYPLYVQGKRQDAGEIISAVFREVNLKNMRTAALFPWESFFLYHTQFPRMPGNELKDAIGWEASKLLTIPLEEAVMDYRVSDSLGEKFHINLVAARKTDVISTAEFLRKNGVNLVVLDVSPMASLKSIVFNEDAGRESSVAFIDIGCKKTEISIAMNGELVFYRVIKAGGDSITRKVMDAREVDYGAAEDMKREVGLTGSMLDVRSVLQEEVDKIMLEIRRSLDYFRGQYRDEYVSDIIMSGGTPMMPGFMDYISGYFDLSVRLADPFARVEVETDLELLRPVFLSSMGLALRKR